MKPPRKVCKCGCGQVTPIAPRTDTAIGRVKGQPLDCVPGHGQRIPIFPGEPYGRLTVIGWGINKHGDAALRCRCNCDGKIVYVTATFLKNGDISSCGCLASEMLGNRNRAHSGANAPTFKHGHTKTGGKSTPTYGSWSSMRFRCVLPSSPSCPSYIRYGGANPPVLICDRWDSFDNFLADMGERPTGTTLGRFLDMGDYAPGNCAWQTKAEQMAERRGKFAVQKYRKARTKGFHWRKT